MGKTPVEKTQEAIKERVAEMKDAQLKRAGVMETALRKFESRNPDLKIRSNADYHATSNQQRRVLGLTDNKSEATHNIVIRIHNAAKRKNEEEE